MCCIGATTAPKRPRGGFTLIEVLIVVVILGILAAVVIAEYGNTDMQADSAATRRQLQVVRHQVELFRAKQMADPDFLGAQWIDLLTQDYIHSVPVNPFNGSTVVAGSPGAGVGWVWRDTGSGQFGMYATDNTFVAEFPE